MISAPSEIRCMSIPTTCITANTAASVSGMASATTRAGPDAEADEADHKDDAHGLPERSHELADRAVDMRDWSATMVTSMPTAGLGFLVDGGADALAEVEDVAAFPHGDGKADRVLPVDRNIGVADRRRPGGGGDVGQPNHPVADGEVDLGEIGLGLEGTGDADGDALVGRLDHAGRANERSAPSGVHHRTPADAAAGEVGRENSTRMRSSCAPRR